MPVSSSFRSGSTPGSGGGPRSPCERASDCCAPRLHDNHRPARASSPSEVLDGSAAPAVLVVFADHAGCPWLRALRRGFRHCFVVLRAGSVWLACDPLKDRIALHALELPGHFDLAAFYREQGHRVLVGRRPPPTTRRRLALAPLTCVTVVKRVLGVDAPWVWTPWQLYAHLSGAAYGFTPWSASAGPQNRTVTNPPARSP